MFVLVKVSDPLDIFNLTRVQNLDYRHQDSPVPLNIFNLTKVQKTKEQNKQIKYKIERK